MAPDLNSLPPSQPQSGSSSPLPSRAPVLDSSAGQPHSPPSSAHTPPHSLSHSHPHSLAATAALNAGMHTDESRHSISQSSRRRSSIRANLTLNDPTIPGPGELQISPSLRARMPSWSTSSPHHERAPSLGELHQELESEQEAQVNRLLHMIRHQQAQIAALTTGQTTSAQAAQSSAIDDSTTPTSERSMSLPTSQTSQVHPIPLSHQTPSSRARSPLPSHRSSLSNRDPSRGSSHAGSPSLRAMSSSRGPTPQQEGDWSIGGSAIRNETAFYQAETQNLTRENQMLKLRIRELERQLAEANLTSPQSPTTHSIPAAGLEAAPSSNIPHRTDDRSTSFTGT